MGDRRALVGRDREVAALTTFLDEGLPGGLVLTGEAGLGKSALWELAGSLAVERAALVLAAGSGAPPAAHNRGSEALAVPALLEPASTVRVWNPPERRLTRAAAVSVPSTVPRSADAGLDSTPGPARPGPARRR